MKIFVFGFNKTGTKSLESALSTIGFVHCPFEAVWGIFDNIKDNKPILDNIDIWDVYSDYPIYEPKVFSHIVDEYPNAKFISLTRNLDDYVESVLKHKIRDLENGVNDSWNWLGIGDKKSYKNYPQYQKEWVKGRAEFKHSSNIRLLNKKKINYLDMNICDNNDGCEKLCKILDRPIPNKDFPYSTSQLPKSIKDVVFSTQKSMIFICKAPNSYI